MFSIVKIKCALKNKETMQYNFTAYFFKILRQQISTWSTERTVKDAFKGDKLTTDHNCNQSNLWWIANDVMKSTHIHSNH